MATPVGPPAPAPRRNHALWIGPLLALTGTISYFTVFVRWPALRDVPWVNLPLAALGAIVTLVGARQAFRRGAGRGGRALAAVSLVLGVLPAGMFAAYVFVLSSLLPEPSAATLALAEAPEFALPDHRGDIVRLSELRGRKVVLTFYRGHW
jgi:hypothetical protein